MVDAVLPLMGYCCWWEEMIIGCGSCRLKLEQRRVTQPFKQPERNQILVTLSLLPIGHGRHSLTHPLCPYNNIIFTPAPLCWPLNMPTATSIPHLLDMVDDPTALNSLSKFTLFETKR